MRFAAPGVLLLLAVIVLVSSVPVCLNPEARAAGGLPVFFIPNEGQMNADVLYMATAANLAAWFTAAGPVLEAGGASVRLDFARGNPAPRIESVDKLEGRVNFFLGGGPEQWKTDVPTYRGVVYREVYPGIDVYYLGSGDALKSEYVVAPGADPAAIRIAYRGAKRVRVDADGALVLSTPSGELREGRPDIYQELGGERVAVRGGYRLLGGGEAGFEIGEYDRSHPLVIDPILSYSTYLGGGGMDTARAIAVDGHGHAYVTGHTDSWNLPAVNAMQGSNRGGVDAFVAKLNLSGNALVYCTYLGGSSDDRGFGIAVDSSGSAYVTGWTSSSNFPTTSGARQRILGGGRDAFAARLSPAGNSLVYSTYLGGANHDSGNAIAVDSAGNAYIAGDTYSTNFPVVNAFQTSSRGRQEAFVSKLKGDGTALLWSTYLGGYGDDRAAAIAVDASGQAYVTGGTDSPNFPTASPLQAALAGGQDGFVTKLAADGKSLVYSTYLGGSAGAVGTNEMGTGIQVDRAGSAYVAGVTPSPNFPVVNDVQPFYGGGSLDAFVAKLNPAGSALVYSTYLGGAGADYATSISVNLAGTAAVAGYTTSTNFPVLSPLQAMNGGGWDAFVAKLKPQGGALESATYWGGSGSEAANGIFMDAAGNVWLAGQTSSTNFPVKNAIQPVNSGPQSAFVTKLGEVTPTAVFRSTSGVATLTSYGSTLLHGAGGFISSDLAISQNAAGDTYIAGGNASSRVYMNIFRNETQSWGGWLTVGDDKYGNPALAATPSGEVFIVARDHSYRYYLSHYRPASGFQPWMFLGGSFAVDPVVAAAPDGSAYVLGTSSSGAVWSGRYVPQAGFQGWVSSGSSPQAEGKPAVVAGSDGAMYVAVKGTDEAIWMGRLTGQSWGPWYSGGGMLGSGPSLATSQGTIHAVVTNPGGAVYLQNFLEGTGNGWQGWTYLNGHLEGASVAARGDRLFIAGRSLLHYNLWWYDSGAGWFLVGHQGLAASNLDAAPK